MLNAEIFTDELISRIYFKITCGVTGGKMGLCQWLSGKESTCNARDAGDVSLILGSGRSPGGGHGNLLQCSCLENPMHRGAWWATVHALVVKNTSEV